MMPGMKPAAKDFPEKSLERSSFSPGVADVDTASAAEVADADGVIVGSAVLVSEEVVAVGDADEVALLNAEDEVAAASFAAASFADSAMHNLPEHL